MFQILSDVSKETGIESIYLCLASATAFICMPCLCVSDSE